MFTGLFFFRLLIIGRGSADNIEAFEGLLNRVSDYIKGGPHERHSKINEHFECGIPSFIDSGSICSI